MTKQFIHALMVLAVFLAIGGKASANTIYMAQSQAGGNSGADCADATALSKAAWAAGNTYYLCGTITSQVAPSTSGTSSAPITIIFASGASITQTACGSSGCINLAGLSYITVDGGTTCGVTTDPTSSDSSTPCNGTIQATGNGTGSGSGESIGINLASGASHIEIRNLNIINMYVHTGTGNDTPSGNYYAINLVGNNVLIHNNIIHDCGGGVVANPPTNNVSIYNNEIYNCNWGTFFSGSSTVSGINTIKVYGNRLHDWANWDTTSDAYHHDGIFFAGNDNNADGVSGADIYDNYLYGTISDASVCTSASGSCMTALIFVNDANTIRTYNNLLTPQSGQYVNNGWIFYWSPGTLQHNDLIANNTVMGGSLSSGACIYVEGDSSMTLQNNVLSGCTYLLWTTSNTTFTALSNNVYQNASLSGSWRMGNTEYSSLASWQSAIGADQNSQATTSSLNLNGNDQPESGCIANTMASNLTPLDIAALDADKAGVARANSGSWTAGAYTYASSGTVSGPTALTAKPH